MATTIKLLVDKLTANQKQLFLLDGCGAFLTAFLLILIRAKFQSVVGMPRRILYFLSFVAFIYAAYSFCCYFFVRRKWLPHLKIITIANTLYCCLTICLVFYHYDNLTIPGIIYFLLEAVVISGLIYIEGMAVSRLL